MKYSRSNPPIAIKESDVIKVWESEPWDENLPEPGFLTDLVLATRGFETTTKFALWGGLFVISSLLKRDAWFKWFPKHLYPNLYVLFVAPPRICAKSTAVDFCEDALLEVPNLLEDRCEELAYRKRMNIHHSKATPEVLNDLLAPEKKEMADGLTVSRGSQLTLIISELTTFLGRQKYNVGLVDVLTKLYDSRSTDDEATRGMGKKVLEDVYVTLFGATTPSSFRDSIPEEAMGGGFLSRTIIVAENSPTRYHPFPIPVPGAPDVAELSERLAWIAENAVGEYVLSREAYQAYCEWYRPFKNSLVHDPNADARARMDTNLMKIALLIRAQRYEPGNVVTLKDFLTAKTLLEGVYQESHDLMKEVTAGQWAAEQMKLVKILQLQDRYSEHELWLKFLELGLPEERLASQLEQLIKSGSVITEQKEGGRWYAWRN